MEFINSFNISFGEIPTNYISRNEELENIISIFQSQTPQTKSLAITGPRGCGKTVLLSKAKKYFDSLDNFITIDVNPYSNILEQLASQIYEKGKLKKYFLKKEFDFSFHGFSFSITGSNPVSNINTLLDIMLKYLLDKNIKLLIIIDDIDSSTYVKEFVYSYQSYLREGYLVFLLTTGLYENISKLENTNNLTFLLRTPKITLTNLNYRAIAYSYESIFEIDINEAIKLAKITKGYAYAYQLLGNILYNNNTTSLTKKVLREFDLALDENVYSKIWSSLTNVEKTIIKSICKSNNIKDIIIDTKYKNGIIQTYKKRLLKQGLISDNERGKINFSLPRFKEFVEIQIAFEEE